MLRKAHWLKGNQKSETIHTAIWVDTETAQHLISNSTVAHSLTIGFAAYSRRLKGGKWSRPEWFKFTNISEFWEWVDSKARQKTKLYLFCHNTNFDLTVLDTFSALPALGYELKFAVIEAPPTILKFVKDKKSIVILDTLNFWRVSLKALGKSIGLLKLSMPDKDASIADWNTYCQRDTEIIMVAVQKWADFILHNDFGGFGFTIAGQALKLYRHRYMFSQIGIHDNDNACNLERDSYKGGRNECFYLGELRGNYKLFDVNSMYPFVMRNNLFPTRLKYYSERKSIEDIKRLLEKYAVIAKVRVKTDKTAYCLKFNHKLIFPIGEFDISLTTPELKYALEQGHIIKVYSCSVYKQENIFKDYVDDIYAKRLQAIKDDDAIGKILYKLLLNSLYGKFGQKGIVYEKEFFDPNIKSHVWTEKDIDTGIITKWRALAGLVQCEKTEIEGRDSFPAIAAHVTAFARMHLYDLIKGQGKSCVYCDTDSLLLDCSSTDYDESLIPLGNKLGELKEERKCTTGFIWGCKDYRLNNIDKHKGIKSKAVWLSENTVQQERWSSLIGQLRDENMTAPTTAKVVKTLHRVYSKGYCFPNGVIKPLEFASGEFLDKFEYLPSRLNSLAK